MKNIYSYFSFSCISRISWSIFFVACISWSVVVHAAPTIRNGAEFDVFKVAPPKLRIVSVTADKPAYRGGNAVTLTVTVNNPDPMSHDVAVDLTVTDPAGKETFRKTDEIISVDGTKQKAVTFALTLAKTASMGGYAANAVVKFNGVAAVTKDIVALFMVNPPPPLTISPATATLARSGKLKFTVTGSELKPVFTIVGKGPTGNPYFYGDITADGDYTGGQVPGNEVTIRVRDELGRTADAKITTSAELQIMAMKGTDAEPGGKLQFWYTGGSGLQTAKFEIADNQSGGSFDPVSTGIYTAGMKPGVKDLIRMTDLKTGKTSELTVTIAALLKIEPQSVALNPGGRIQLKITGGIPGVQRIFQMNKGAESLGTITPDGVFTAGDLPATDQSQTVQNAIYAKVDGSVTPKSMYSFAYADVVVVRKPLPLAIDPAEATVTNFEKIQFNITGGEGPLTMTADGFSLGAIKNGGWYMAGSKTGPDIITVKDAAGHVVTAKVLVVEEEPGVKEYILGWAEYLPKIGGLVGAYNKGEEIYTSYKEYSEFGGYMFQGPYRKGATVKATNLNNRSLTATSEVLENNGRYFIRVPWIGPTLIEATGPFEDEFTGNVAEIPDELSAVASGRKYELVECSLNVPTSIAAEMVDDKSVQRPDHLLTNYHVLLANKTVGHAIGLSGDSDITRIRLGDSGDSNLVTLTNFHLAVVAVAGPESVVAAVRQLAREIVTHKPLGSSESGVVRTADLNKTLDAIKSGKDLTAKTANGETISVPLSIVMRRMGFDTKTPLTAMVDSDGDGLSDSDEINIFKTDPKVADTDKGGVKDGQEVKDGTNPLNYADDKVPGVAGNIEWTSSTGQKAATFDVGSHESTIEFPGAATGTVTKIVVPPGYEAVVNVAK